MKKALMMGLFLSSALILGACSDDSKDAATDEKGQKEAPQEEVKKEEVKKDNDTITFEVDGEKVEEKLESPYIKGTLAKSVHLPSEFDTKNVDDELFQAVGSGEYEDFLFFVEKENAASSLDRNIFSFKRGASMQIGDKETKIYEYDLSKYPELAKKYDYALKSEMGIGNKFTAFKIIGDERVVVAVTIKNKEKLNYDEFALELLRKVELPEPA